MTGPVFCLCVILTDLNRYTSHDTLGLSVLGSVSQEILNFYSYHGPSCINSDTPAPATMPDTEQVLIRGVECIQ